MGEADRIGSSQAFLGLIIVAVNTLRKPLTPYSVRCSVRSIPISPAWSLFLLGAGLNLASHYDLAPQKNHMTATDEVKNPARKKNSLLDLTGFPKWAACRWAH